MLGSDEETSFPTLGVCDEDEYNTDPCQVLLTTLKFTFHFPFQQASFRKKLYEIHLGNGFGGLGHRLFSNMGHKYVLMLTVKTGNSLVVWLLGLGTFTAKARV